MFGWRGRVGFIQTEIVKRDPYEWYKVVPEGVAFLAITYTKQKEKETKNLEKAVKDLSKWGAQCIIYGCTTRVTQEKQGPEDELIKLMEDVSGKPATTTLRAAADAMHHLSIKRILLSGNHDDERTGLLKKYLENQGFQVPYTSSMPNAEAIRQDMAALLGLGSYEVCSMSYPDDLCYTLTMRAFRKLPSKDAIDGIYLPGAGWAIHKYLNMLEEDTGIPVVSTHRSNVWWALRTLKIEGPIRGYGKLLETL